MIQGKPHRNSHRPSGLPIRTTKLISTHDVTNSQSVPNLLATNATPSIPKTCSFQSFKQHPAERESKALRKSSLTLDLSGVRSVEHKRKLSEVDDGKGAFTRAAKIPATVFAADCETVVKRLFDRTVAAVREADGSKRSSTEFDDSLGSFLSEQVDLLAVNSSITRLHLLDRTPSVEDLPLEIETHVADDPGGSSTAPNLPIVKSEQGDLECSLELSTSSFSSSQTHKLMNVDNGYQGDGELSRPDSRNAESLSTNDPNCSLVGGKDAKAPGIMTDSDFFTESDLDDGHGIHRRAQIIDGTLYSAGDRTLSGNVNRNGEDMESSGVFSDLERKQDKVVVDNDDGLRELITEQIRTIRSLVREAAAGTMSEEAAMVKSSSGDSTSTIQEPPTVCEPPETVSATVKKRPAVAKPSATVTKTNMPLPKEPLKKKGVGKWDAVMDKIAQNKENNLYTPERFRNVKSRVFQVVKLDSPATVYKAKSRKSTRVRNSAKAAAVAAAAAQSNSVATCSTGSCSSQHSSISDISAASSSILNKNGTSKKRETISVASTVSAPRLNIPNKPDNKKVLTSQRKNDLHATTKTETTMKPPGSTRVHATRLPPPKLSAINSKPLTDLNQNASIGKTAGVLITNGNNVNHNNKGNLSQQRGRSVRQQATSNAAQTAINTSQNEIGLLQNLLRDSNRKVEAFAVLLGYCTHQLEAFKMPMLRKKLDAELDKSKNLETELSLMVTKNDILAEKINRLEADLTERTEIQLQLEQTLTERLGSYQELEKQLERSQRNEKNLNNIISEKNNCQRQLEEELAVRLAAEKLFEEKIAEFVDRERIYEQDLKDAMRRCKIQRDRETALISQLSALRLENSGLKEEAAEKILSRELSDTKNQSSKVVISENGSCDTKRRRGSCDKEEGTSQQTLVSEVESLREVLALKTAELTELRRNQLHLQIEADRVPNLLSQIASFEAKLEVTQLQLNTQTTQIGELSQRCEQLRDDAAHAQAHAQRIQQKNEELQYKLRVNSEAMWQLVTSSYGTPNGSGEGLSPDGSPGRCRSIASTPRHHRDSKPRPTPRNPEMASVVQKSDSMSYVLDVDGGESPGDIVARVINRVKAKHSTPFEKNGDVTQRSSRTLADSFVTCRGSPLRLSPVEIADDQPDVIEISKSFDRVSDESDVDDDDDDDDEDDEEFEENRFDIESEAYPEQDTMLFAGEAMVSEDDDDDQDLSNNRS